MRLLPFVLGLIPTIIAAVDEYGSPTAGTELYNSAVSLLSEMPMFTTRHTEEEQITILELQMDYDFALERAKYRYAMDNLTEEQLRALELLKESSQAGNVDATFMLAEINMYGNYSFPQNGTQAFHYYHQVAELTPNATAYFNLAFMYSTGLFGELEIDQAKANLYYQFAFEQGDLRAAMVLGYRYYKAVALPYDCNKSRFYYQIVADKLKETYYDTAPLGGPHLDSFNLRVWDFQDGVYGKNVGDMKSSLTRKSNRHDEILQSDVLTTDEFSIYDQFFYKAIRNYEGSYIKPRNFTKAYRYASSAYHDGMVGANRLQKYEKYYLARCIYLMAHMYMRGEGVEQDLQEALKLLKEALSIYPQTSIYNDLVLIYGKGPEGVRDLKQAGLYLKNSSAVLVGPDKLNYGSLSSQFTQKESQGFISLGIEGYYHQASVFDHSKDEPNCPQIVANLRHFAEAFDPMITSLQWAFAELMEGRSQNALIGYAMAAEQGFEMAQTSAAFLMYQPPGILEDPPNIPKERREMAKVYLTRASDLYNLDATVLLGDMYFGDKEYEKAVDCYEAAEGRQSSQASFNLGWLYEFGYGVEQDFHLAKRHYDLALNGHTKAYLAVQIALFRLRFRNLVNNIFGYSKSGAGAGGSVQAGTTNGNNANGNTHGGDDLGEGEETKKRTWADWMKLYQRVRGSTQLPSDYEAEVQNTLSPDVTEPQEDIILTDDVLLILFFAGAFAMFWIVYMVQQRQLRRRLAAARRGGEQQAAGAANDNANAAANGNANANANPGEVQVRFEFGFLAI